MESLSETCAAVREVVTPRGSRFLLCQLSQTDPAFPKYPPSRSSSATATSGETNEQETRQGGRNSATPWELASLP
jgi:hypothetical protein